MRRAAGTLVAAALLLGLAADALAFLPPPSRLLAALADANRRAGRAARIALTVDVVRGESAPVGTGTLVLDPVAGAQLELRRADGDVELHRRRGATLEVLRNGEPVRRAEPLLPPWEILQAPTPESLAAALTALGIDTARVDLGLDGPRDLFVVGGRDRPVGALGPPRRAALWIDQETLDVARIDSADGVRWVFGPTARVGGVRLPGWVEVQPPEGDRLRLVIRGAHSAPR